MSFFTRIKRSIFFIRLRSWEYWPFSVVQFPVVLYFLWLALRARSLTFFSASNPGIVMGGMFGESKYDVLKKIPQPYVPKTVLVKQPSNVQAILDLMQTHNLSFPLIFKPDLGERGFMVKRITNESDIKKYLGEMRFNFLIQELVDLPLELGVFYCRFPHEQNGKVISVVVKEMLSVTGDGERTLQQLILDEERAKLQWKTLSKTFAHRLDETIPAGEKIELVSIGNHCLGTRFINGNHLINDQLSFVFDAISEQIDGFYYGRYDLRCETLDDLYAGRVSVMELNGCGAEPAHIYHSGYPLIKGLGDIFRHWKNIFRIARANAANGASYTPLREAWFHYKTFKLTRRLPQPSTAQRYRVDERMVFSEELR